MRNYNNDLMLGFLRKINEKNLIELNQFSKNLDVDKSHAEWIINDLISKGYISKNELGCSSDCRKTDCDDIGDSYQNRELKMFLELTEKGKKLIF